MTDKLQWIFYENPTRPNPGNGKSSDVKQQPENVKQPAPKTEPAQKKHVKLAKD